MHARIEFRHNTGQIFNCVLFPVVSLVLLYFVTDSLVSEAEMSVATRAISGVLAMNIVFTGMIGLAMMLIVLVPAGLLFIAVVAVSGVFFPLAALPQWAQWIGLGLLPAMLPEAIADVELASSRQHMETFGVLGAWAAIGFVVAPVVLRGMAGNTSGSRVTPLSWRAARQENN
ncbi:hypothetical protein GCM10027590_62350 [Nocardiopsis nanhaiensis]